MTDGVDADHARMMKMMTALLELNLVIGFLAIVEASDRTTRR